MALPNSDILEELNKLILLTTGFRESNENFINCKKYCLSYFVHHSYPAVNKTNVRSAIDGFATRFYTHGYVDVADALKAQAELFLTHQDIFRANPEFDIEWNLLSLVCSLASNLNEVKSVPDLLPVVEEIEPEDNFDWGAYLKNGLPEIQDYSQDSESDSISITSSASSTSNDDFDTKDLCSTVQRKENDDSSIPHPAYIKWIPKATPPFWRGQYEQMKETRKKELDVERDIAKFGNFSCKWYEFCKKQKPEISKPKLVSEKQAVETILYSLFSGNATCLQEHTVCYLAMETFTSCLKSLEPCIAIVSGLRKFVDNKLPNPTVIMKGYVSSIERCLFIYELNILDIREEGLPLFKTLESIRPHLSFLRSIQVLHRQCISGFDKDPPWKCSLRILIVLYISTISCTNEQLKALYFAIFMTCFSHFAEVLDSLITTSRSSTALDDFVIVRDHSLLPSQLFRIHPYRQLLEEFNLSTIPFLEPVVEQILHSDSSLTLVCLLNRFSDLWTGIRGLPTLREVLIDTVEAEVGELEIEEDSFDLCGELARFLFNETDGSSGENKEKKKLVNFFEIIRNTKPFDCFSRIHKEVEIQFHHAFTMRIDRVRLLAKQILFEEFNLERYLTVLRNVLLFNNISQLMPFTQVFVTGEDTENSKKCGYHLFLSSLLRTCVESDYPDLASLISVEVINDCNFLDIFEAIDNTVIRFDVPYPVSLVLTPVALAKCNNIFRVLLKLKYVHTMLCRLPFLEKEVDVVPEVMPVVQRLQIQRFTCLTELGLIMNYFMAQVTTPLHSSMEEYEDVQDIIKDYAIRLEEMHIRCMLSPEDLNYKVIFNNLLPLYLDLQKCWSLKDVTSVQNLKWIEKRHETYQIILRSIMQNLECEMYDPRHAMFLPWLTAF